MGWLMWNGEKCCTVCPTEPCGPCDCTCPDIYDVFDSDSYTWVRDSVDCAAVCDARVGFEYPNILVTVQYDAGTLDYALDLCEPDKIITGIDITGLTITVDFCGTPGDPAGDTYCVCCDETCLVQVSFAGDVVYTFDDESTLECEYNDYDVNEELIAESCEECQCWATAYASYNCDYNEWTVLGSATCVASQADLPSPFDTLTPGGWTPDPTDDLVAFYVAPAGTTCGAPPCEENLCDSVPIPDPGYTPTCCVCVIERYSSYDCDLESWDTPYDGASFCASREYAEDSLGIPYGGGWSEWESQDIGSCTYLRYGYSGHSNSCQEQQNSCAGTECTESPPEGGMEPPLGGAEPPGCCPDEEWSRTFIAEALYFCEEPIGWVLDDIISAGCDNQAGEESPAWSAWQSSGDPCIQEAFYVSETYISEEDCLAASWPAEPALPEEIPEGCCCDTSGVDLCVTSFIPPEPCTCADFGWEGEGVCTPPAQSGTLTIMGVDYAALYTPGVNSPLQYTGVADFGSGAEGFSITIDPLDLTQATLIPDVSSPCILLGYIECLDGSWTGFVQQDCGGGVGEYQMSFNGAL